MTEMQIPIQNKFMCALLYSNFTLIFLLDFCLTLRKSSRVRGALLPQEYDLSRALRNVPNLRTTWTTDNSACKWMGVKCDADLQVIEIKWSYMGLEGTVSWRDFPRTLRVLIMGQSAAWYRNRLTGSLSSPDLPPLLAMFNIEFNNFSGEIALEYLPANLLSFEVAQNSFEGTASIHALPLTLIKLDLDKNLFSGRLNLMNLPSKFERLLMSNNMFSGSIVLTHLPNTILYVDLSDNNLSGEIDLSSLPPVLTDLSLRNNNFFGHIDLSNTPDSLLRVDLLGNNITSVTPYPFPDILLLR